MVDVITWALGAGLAIVSIFLVYVIYKFALPARNTILGKILEAKEKRKAVVFMWQDGFYEVDVAEDEGANFIKTKKWYITTPPGTINYTKGGIRVVFADGYKGLAMRLTIMLLINEFVRLKLTKEDIMNILKAIDHGILPEDIKKHKERLTNDEYFRIFIRSTDPQLYNELYNRQEGQGEDKDVQEEERERTTIQ